MKKNDNVTSIEELIEVSKGDLVELPPFSEGKPFFARLKRPSMLAMVKAGKIPNELLTEANKLFAKGVGVVAKEGVADVSMMNNMFVILEEICKASFVEPTYQQIVEAGVELTDEQQMFVFSYSQSGVKALKSFRKQWGNIADNRDVQAIGGVGASIGSDGNS